MATERMNGIGKRESAGEWSDDDLIAQTRRGDLRSFDALVRRYQRKVYFLALRMVKNHDAADDIAQETFIKAYRAIDSFKPGYNFFTWVYRICMNLSINHLKRGKRVMTESSFREEARPLEREAPGADPLDRVAAKEMEERIEAAVDSLSPKYKAVFVLRIYEEMSYEEIAGNLGLSVGTVMSRLFRAREKMQEMLKDYGSDSGEM
jgi:RNA polymerase sigma-70 factor (ECF subfamily)